MRHEFLPTDMPGSMVQTQPELSEESLSYDRKQTFTWLQSIHSSS